MKRTLFAIATILLLAVVMKSRPTKSVKVYTETEQPPAAAEEPAQQVMNEPVNDQSAPASATTPVQEQNAPEVPATTAAVTQSSIPNENPPQAQAPAPEVNPQAQIAESELAAAGCTFSTYKIPGSENGVIENKLTCSEAPNVSIRMAALRDYIKKITEATAANESDNASLYDKSASVGDALATLVMQAANSQR